MARNSIGKNLVLTSFGESHGDYIGAVLDGIPAGLSIDQKSLAYDMARRRPGQSNLSTPRNEEDQVQCISGVFEEKTTGAPITLLIANKDTRPADYDALATVYRPGHADLLYDYKYGHRDHRGGGRSSARVTAAWVAAGNIAKQYLQSKTELSVIAWVNQVHQVVCPELSELPTLTEIEKTPVRCPHAETAQAMMEAIAEAKAQGDSLGGIVSAVVSGAPVGLGEPVFGKLQSVVSQYIFSINAVKGLSFGEGFAAAAMKGSEHNDVWAPSPNANQPFSANTNHAGGIIGGISNGLPITLDVAFKPTSTIAKSQQTLNANFEAVELQATGRHDPCVLPRAVPIVEAMLWLALTDLYLESPSK